MPEVALVHDYLTQRGGAERVVLAMARTFPDAPLYTSVYAPERTYAQLREIDVRTTPLDRLPPLRRNHRLAFPLLAGTFSRLTVDAAVTLVSSSGWAHGVRATGRKIVYCHAPARWLYQAERYQRGSGRMARLALGVASRRLKDWDWRSAHTAHRYLVNSSAVRDAVQNLYGIRAELLPPPHSANAQGRCRAVHRLEPGYLLVVSRLLSYKNVDAIAEAMRHLPDQKLVVVGTGPEAARLTRTAPANVEFLGTVDEDQLRWLYSHAAALVAASHEDFGLTPMEAGAYGTPSVVLRFGGFMDTVIESQTGLFFDGLDPASIADAVRRALATAWDRRRLQEWASTFSEQAFAARLREVVAEEAASSPKPAASD